MIHTAEGAADLDRYLLQWRAIYETRRPGIARKAVLSVLAAITPPPAAR